MAGSADEQVTLVLLATAWGPWHGGINAFNVELARSLGITPGRSFGPVWVVPEASADDHEDATRLGVALSPLGSAPGVLSPGDAAQVLSRLSGLLTDRAIRLGHDDKTGLLALALRQQCPGGQMEMLVPGLADPDPDTVNLSDQPPHNFTAFIGGRLGSDDERIKQALLGVPGYG